MTILFTVAQEQRSVGMGGWIFISNLRGLSARRQKSILALPVALGKACLEIARRELIDARTNNSLVVSCAMI